MEKPKLYFYLSIGSIILTFTTGLGIFASFFLLAKIASEKGRLSRNYLVGNENKLKILKNARTINIVNLTLYCIVILYVLLMYFITKLKSPAGHNMWQ